MNENIFAANVLKRTRACSNSEADQKASRDSFVLEMLATFPQEVQDIVSDNANKLHDRLVEIAEKKKQERDAPGSRQFVPNVNSLQVLLILIALNENIKFE